MKYANLRTLHPAATFLGMIVFFQMMGGLMGWITAQSVDGWYRTLERSPVNPPDWAFGAAWTTLYIFLATALWLVFRAPRSRERVVVLSLFAAHMLLNWLWTPLFFTLHLLLPSFLLILLLIFTAAMLAWLIYPLNKWAALLLVPYLGWLTLAGHLAHYIWRHN